MNKSILAKVVDYFIYEEYLNNSKPEELWLYQCFSGMILFIVLIVSVSVPLQLFGIYTSDFKPGITILLSVSLLLIFKHKGYFLFIVNLSCFFIFIILSTEIINNGFLFSEGNIFFVLIPIMSFIFGGIRNGLIWLGVVVAFLVFLYLETIGYCNFFPDSSPYRKHFFSLLLTIELIVLILGLTYIIYNSKSMVINQLAVNEQRIKLKAKELEEKTTELEKLKSELVIRNKNLSKYAAITAHDLKQPLRTITSFAELLKLKLQSNESSEIKEYLSFIISGSSAMKEQVDKILDITNLSKEIVFSSLNTKKVIEHTLKMLNSQIESTKATVEIKEMPTEIIANEVSIQKVFQNLISNGIKFNNKGNVKIEISGIETPNEWQFIVKDNGKGIDKAEQQRIFGYGERINQANEGHGIGLDICKRLIGLHKGKIWVNSTLEKGSEFFFSIQKNLQSA